jgi:hypothetical protein
MILYTSLRRFVLFAGLLLLSHLSFSQTTYWKATRVKAGDNFFGELLKYMFADLRLSINEAQQQLVLYYPSEDTLVIKDHKVILNEDTTTLIRKNNTLILYSKHRRDTVSVILQEAKDTTLFFKSVRSLVDRDTKRQDSFYVKHGVFKPTDFPRTATENNHLWSLGKQLVITLPAGYFVKQSQPTAENEYLDSATIRYQYQLLKEANGSLQTLGDFYLVENKNAFTNWQKIITTPEPKSFAWKQDSGYIRMRTTFNLNSHKTKLDSYKIGRFFSFPDTELRGYFFSDGTSTQKEALEVYSLAAGIRAKQSADATTFQSVNDYIASLVQQKQGNIPGTWIGEGSSAFYLPFFLKYSEFGVGSTGYYQWEADQLQISSDSTYCRKFSFDKLVPAEKYYHIADLYAVARPAAQFSLTGFIKTNLDEYAACYYQNPNGLIYTSRGRYNVLLHRYDNKAGQHYLFHADEATSLDDAVNLFITGERLLHQKETPAKMETAEQYRRLLSLEENKNIDSVLLELKKSIKGNDRKENLWFSINKIRFAGLNGYDKISLPDIQPSIINAIATQAQSAGKFNLNTFFGEKYQVKQSSMVGINTDSVVYKDKNLVILKGDYASADAHSPYYNLYYYTGYNKLSTLIYLDEVQFSLPYTYFLAALLQQAFGN